MVVLLVICREKQLTFVSAPKRILGATPRALGPKLSWQACSKSAPAENHLDKPDVPLKFLSSGKSIKIT